MSEIPFKLITIIPLFEMAYRDFRYFRIPNRDVLMLAVIGLLSIQKTEMGLIGLNLILVGTVFGTIRHLHPEGMGMGDIKLAIVLGVVFPQQIWLIIVIGSITGFMHGLIIKRKKRTNPLIPYGAHLSLISVIFLFI